VSLGLPDAFVVGRFKKQGRWDFAYKKEQRHDQFVFPQRELTSEEMDDSAECKRLLNLDPDIYEFRLVFGATAESKQEIAVQAR